GSGGGVGCVVVVPAVERQRIGVGGGVVLEMVTERRCSVAAWVVVAVGYGGEWGESGVDDWIDRSKGNKFGFAGKSPPEKVSGGGSVVVAVAAGWLGWPAVVGWERVCVFIKNEMR
nr:hypothetical protein [Tanacetum cinerariifolium]GFC20732.1 hypothetical protein [Tanacetum cinerariifolium]